MRDSRIQVILSLIQDLASGDLEARGEKSERSDELDAVIEGLNMLGEELAQHTVSLTRYEALVQELRKALREVRNLTGLLPICAWCKKIRQDDGYWELIEIYITEHSDASFTHGVCPDCLSKLKKRI